MAQVTCSRCFAVFDDGPPGLAPLCPACAARAPARARSPLPPALERAGAGRPGPRRAGSIAAAALALALTAAGGGVLARRAFAPAAPPPRLPTPAEEAAAGWLAAGVIPPLPPAAERPARAQALIEEARTALVEDRPDRTAAALGLFRAALAAAPDRAEAAAGYATAFADRGAEDAAGPDLQAAHAIVRDALARAPERPDLLAAYARLLLAVQSAANDGEALGVATRALAAAPRDPAVRLAHGLARARRDPAAGAVALESAAGEAPADRRLLTAAARARWAARDAGGALALVRRRLAIDAGHPGALSLRVEIETATARLDAARTTLARWGKADPTSPLPLLLSARLAYQLDGDPGAARRLLDAALERRPDDFTAARILAHRAALERAAGDLAAAGAAVDEALRRVPGSAPARYQAALLAHAAGRPGALRESAGVLGGRAGPLVTAQLAARSAELSGTLDEAVHAYDAVLTLAARDPEALLVASGGLARLRATGPALRAAEVALARDPLEARLRRAPTDFWEGPPAVAEASRRLVEIGRSEPRAAATAYAAAAFAELVLGHTRAAEQLARAAGEAAPQSATPLVLVANVMLERGQPREAIPLLRAAVDGRPGDPVALATWARALEALGRNDDAERTHRAALDGRPDLATARLGLARRLAGKGDAAGARVALEALLLDDPGLAPAQGALLALAEAGGASASP
jgi:cellulose synthase operon protein C